MKIVFTLAGILAGMPLCFSLLGAPSSSVDWDTRIRDLKEALPGFFEPSTILTKPLPVDRAIAEWEPISTVVVGIPLGDAMGQPGVMSYYASLITASLKYVDVAVLHSAQDERNVQLFLKRLERGGMSNEALSRIRFIKSLSGGFWTRDTGPLFGLNPQGGLVVFDNIYRPLIEELDAWDRAPVDIQSPDLQNDIEGFEVFRKSNRNAEVVPIYVTKSIRQNYQILSDIVRPPLHLQGGDYLTDGQGSFYISEDTLLENGGSIREVEVVFRDYYGGKRLFVLNALPGNAAKHLDLLVKLVDRNTVLVANGQRQSPNSSPYNRRLAAEMEGIRRANESYLKSKRPHLKIVGVPMLPVVEEDIEFVKRRLRFQLFATICDEIGVSYLKYHRLGKDDPQRSLVHKRVLGHAANVLGRPIDLLVDEDLDSLTRLYFDEDLNTLIDTNVDTSTIYRSYLNSLFILNSRGESAWLLPRYKPRGKETGEEIGAIEKEVERIYQSVSPEAAIHWIDSDIMAEKLGAIHCTTFTIPYLKDIKGDS